MARIRTVKPEFWSDEKIVQLPFEARLLFIGIWNFCDDEGYLWDEPERIRMQVLPGDAVDAEMLVDLLLAASLLDLFVTASGRRILCVRTFDEHQKISNPARSRIVVEVSRKVTIPLETRRAVAKKYGCEPGGEKDVECYYCGSPGHVRWWTRKDGRPSSWVSFSLELEHLEAESAGGEATKENIVLACRHCNRSKGDKPLSEFVCKGIEVSRALPIGREGKGKEVDQERKGNGCPPSRTPAGETTKAGTARGLHSTQYAESLLTSFNLAATHSAKVATASVISSVAKNGGMDEADAHDLMKAQAREAEAEGTEIKRFFFEDGNKFTAKAKTAPKQPAWEV